MALIEDSHNNPTTLSIATVTVPYIMSLDYGLDTTGATDVASALNTFLDDLSTTGQPGILAPGTYRCEDVIWPRSNTTLYAHGATLVHAMPAVVGVNDWDQLFRIQHQSNVRIYGLSIDGNLAGFPGHTEYRHAFSILGGDHIELRDVTAYDAKGDGIYIGHHNTEDTVPPVHVTVENARCYGNYRQGMSVVSADGLYVNDSRFETTRGTLPGCGVDIEPDELHQVCKNIHFTRCRFNDNDKQGVRISMIAGGENVQGGITFNQCWSYGNAGGDVEIVRGVDIVFHGCLLEGNGDAPLGV